jgi:hypothetical protein
MRLDVAFLGELFVALAAAKRLLARVTTLMSLQVSQL